MNDLERIRGPLLCAILDALEFARPRIEAIPNAKKEINGISYDLYRWHKYVAISFREAGAVVRDNPADWKYFEIVSSVTTRSPFLDTAAELIDREWNNAEERGLRLTEAAHLIFLAGAEVLLDASVARMLQNMGVDATEVRDGFLPKPFEYMVLDPDQTVRANYCEIVMANRATARLLRKTDSP